MAPISFETLTAVSWIATSIALLLSLGRFWIRARLTQSLRWDDAAHLLGLLGLIAQVSIVSGSMSMIYYMPEELIADRRLKLFLRLNTAAILLTWCCLYAIKASFLLLYRQIFQVSKWFMRAWWLTSIIVFITFWVLIVGTLTKCGSASNLENIAKCNRPSAVQNQRAFIVYSCVLNILTDIAIMALPLTMLKSLHMNPKAKIGLAGIFGVGIITIAFDLVRSVETLTNGSLGSTALWTNLESAIAVIVSCLPSFRALLGPRKTSSAARNASAYGQRSWPLAESGKVYRSLGNDSKQGTESSTAAWPLSEAGEMNGRRGDLSRDQFDSSPRTDGAPGTSIRSSTIEFHA